MNASTLGTADNVTSKIAQLRAVAAGWLDAVRTVPNMGTNAVFPLAASATVNVLSLALPLALMQVYDRILLNRAYDTLVWLLTGATVAMLLECGLRISRSFLAGWIAARFEHLANRCAFESMVEGPLRRFEEEEVGVHLDRLNAIPVLRGGYFGQIFQIMLDLPFALLFLVGIYYVGGGLVLVPILVGVTFLLISVILRSKFLSARTDQLGYVDKRSSFVLEVLRGIHQMKALTLEEQMMRRYEMLQSGLAVANFRVFLWGMMPQNLGGLFSQVAMFGTLGFGA